MYVHFIICIFLFQTDEVEIYMGDENACIFKYVQQLRVQGGSNGRSERLKRIWEPTYM